MSTASVQHILAVEDNPRDVFLLEYALRCNGFPYRLTVATDGEKALELLESLGDTHAHPDLILLDVNLPRITGIEVLSMLRSRPALAELPVAVLSSSASIRERQQAERLGIRAWLQKPLGLDEYEEVGRTIGELLTPA